MTHTLDGKQVVITGASKGLGRALALAFAKAGGARLALIARSEDLLRELKQVLAQEAPDVRVLTIGADLSNEADIERAVALTLHEFGGRVDVLVNNASVLGPAPMPYLLDYPTDEFKNVLATNVIAPFVLIKKFLPGILEAHGSIINVTSDAGVVGYPGWGAYGISKFGLEGMSQTWAAELEDTGVRLNWVDPGAMNTEMHRLAEPEEDSSEWADPADVVDVFLYLGSNASSGVHGKRFQAQEPAWGRPDIAVDEVTHAQRG
jgi:NAD(P)-dependent dehydrogenase (short-subunit alcohol dehydrogenase family)